MRWQSSGACNTHRGTHTHSLDHDAFRCPAAGQHSCSGLHPEQAAGAGAAGEGARRLESKGRRANAAARAVLAWHGECNCRRGFKQAGGRRAGPGGSPRRGCRYERRRQNSSAPAAAPAGRQNMGAVPGQGINPGSAGPRGWRAFWPQRLCGAEGGVASERQLLALCVAPVARRALGSCQSQVLIGGHQAIAPVGSQLTSNTLWSRARSTSQLGKSAAMASALEAPALLPSGRYPAEVLRRRGSSCWRGETACQRVVARARARGSHSTPTAEHPASSNWGRTLVCNGNARDCRNREMP